mmetsp:Transcript_1685/g.2431  ORF Transcript_1685/g.2431 Transcript_1685/m.2431 type:complete len:304 (+) Transcript_1685:162-1073(+)
MRRTEATYLLMETKNSDWKMEEEKKKKKIRGEIRRREGRLSAAEVLGSMEKISLHKINYSAVWSTFLKAFVGCLSLLLIRWGFRQRGYEGSTPLPSVTAFMAGIYFVLSMILKGVLDEYSESSRLPLLVATGVIQYRETWQMFTTEKKVMEISAVLGDMVQSLIDGISHPRSGITTIDEILDTIEKLHGFHVELSMDDTWNTTSACIDLGRQISHIRTLILRADHVARATYLPISFSLSWLIVTSTTVVLLGVEYSTWEQEYTLLPCLVMFVYLFVLFASEMDDPFNIYSSISVSMEVIILCC